MAEYGNRKQKNGYNSTPLSLSNKNSKINHNARVYLNAQNMADAGFKYGANVGLLTTAQVRTNKDSNSLDLTYLFLESGDMVV